jgi:antitoxin component of RelBE/YafQ-DinJ toxin-antitoxin module
MHPKKEQWMEYLYNEMPPPQQQSLTDHLRQCPKCRSQLGAWRTSMRNLDDWKWANGDGGSTRRRWLGPVRWAAAILLILAVGFGVGRLSTTRPDMEQLRMSLASSLEPGLRQYVSQQVKDDWINLLAAGQVQFKEEILRHFRDNLNEFALQSTNASNAALNQILTEFVLSFDQVQSRERYQFMMAMDQLDQQRMYDNAVLRGDLQLLAVQAGDEIMRTQGMVQQLAIKDDKIKENMNPSIKEIDKINNN